jgi:hypothetical protein
VLELVERFFMIFFFLSRFVFNAILWFLLFWLIYVVFGKLPPWLSKYISFLGMLTWGQVFPCLAVVFVALSTKSLLPTITTAFVSEIILCFVTAALLCMWVISFPVLWIAGHASHPLPLMLFFTIVLAHTAINAGEKNKLKIPY